VKVAGAHVSVTLPTLSVPMVPLPLATVQVWSSAWVFTVTLKPLPKATAAGMVKSMALAARLIVSPPLASTRPSLARPLMLPPSVKALTLQVTTTSETAAAAIVPLPLATEQVSPVGWVLTPMA